MKLHNAVRCFAIKGLYWFAPVGTALPAPIRRNEAWHSANLRDSSWNAVIMCKTLPVRSKCFRITFPCSAGAGWLQEKHSAERCSFLSNFFLPKNLSVLEFGFFVFWMYFLPKLGGGTFATKICHRKLGFNLHAFSHFQLKTKILKTGSRTSGFNCDALTAMPFTNHSPRISFTEVAVADKTLPFSCFAGSST